MFISWPILRLQNVSTSVRQQRCSTFVFEVWERRHVGGNILVILEPGGCLIMLRLLLCLFSLVSLHHAAQPSHGTSHVVRSIFPSFRPFPCPPPPSSTWNRPAAAAMLDWSRAAAGTVVVATFDGIYLATFDSSSGEIAVIALPPDKLSRGHVPPAPNFHACSCHLVTLVAGSTSWC